MWSPPFKKAALGLPFFVSLPSKSLVRIKWGYVKWAGSPVTNMSRWGKYYSVFEYKLEINDSSSSERKLGESLLLLTTKSTWAFKATTCSKGKLFRKSTTFSEGKFLNEPMSNVKFPSRMPIWNYMNIWDFILWQLDQQHLSLIIERPVFIIPIM